MLPLKIAWRFLLSSRTQSLFIVAGIAVGIATQVFVGSLITSLQESLIDQTIGSASQITLQAFDDGEPVTFTERIKTVIADDPRVKQGTLVAVRTISALFSDGNDSATLAVIGGDLADLNGIYKLTERTVDGAASLRQGEIMIGKEFADKFNLGQGDTVALTFPGARRGSFTVAGVFDLGSAAFNERTAFVSASAPQSVLGWGSNEYSQVQMQLDEPFDSGAVAEAWRAKLPGVRIVEWQAQNADLLTALQSQSSSSYLIQVFVLVAVALGIASTLAIAAVQKTRQIGILKAMGLSDKKSGRIFLWQALILGGAGSLGGVGLAYLLLLLFSLAPVPFSITPQPLFVVGSALVGVGVALASSIIPTRRTSRLDPIEVIQGG